LLFSSSTPDARPSALHAPHNTGSSCVGCKVHSVKGSGCHECYYGSSVQQGTSLQRSQPWQDVQLPTLQLPTRRRS
jgi:hypothetical protein